MPGDNYRRGLTTLLLHPLLYVYRTAVALFVRWGIIPILLNEITVVQCGCAGYSTYKYGPTTVLTNLISLAV